MSTLILLPVVLLSLLLSSATALKCYSCPSTSSAYCEPKTAVEKTCPTGNDKCITYQLPLATVFTSTLRDQILAEADTKDKAVQPQGTCKQILTAVLTRISTISDPKFYSYDCGVQTNCVTLSQQTDIAQRCPAQTHQSVINLLVKAIDPNSVKDCCTTDMCNKSFINGASTMKWSPVILLVLTLSSVIF